MALKLIGSTFPVSMQTSVSPNSTNYDIVNTGLSITDRVGWLLQRIEDFTRPESTRFNGDGDGIIYGLSVQNLLLIHTSTLEIVLNNPAYKWVQTMYRYDYGTAASANISLSPKTYDFTALPDGGLLMVPQPLYMFASANPGVALAVNVNFRAYFQAVQLADSDYFNILQSNQILLA